MSLKREPVLWLAALALVALTVTGFTWPELHASAVWLFESIANAVRVTLSPLFSLLP